MLADQAAVNLNRGGGGGGGRDGDLGDAGPSHMNSSGKRPREEESSRGGSSSSCPAQHPSKKLKRQEERSVDISEVGTAVIVLASSLSPLFSLGNLSPPSLPPSLLPSLKSSLSSESVSTSSGTVERQTSSSSDGGFRVPTSPIGSASKSGTGSSGSSNHSGGSSGYSASSSSLSVHPSTSPSSSPVSLSNSFTSSAISGQSLHVPTGSSQSLGGCHGNSEGELIPTPSFSGDIVTSTPDEQSDGRGSGSGDRHVSSGSENSNNNNNDDESGGGGGGGGADDASHTSSNTSSESHDGGNGGHTSSGGEGGHAGGSGEGEHSGTEEGDGGREGGGDQSEGEGGGGAEQKPSEPQEERMDGGHQDGCQVEEEGRTEGDTLLDDTVLMEEERTLSLILVNSEANEEKEEAQGGRKTIEQPLDQEIHKLGMEEKGEKPLQEKEERKEALDDEEVIILSPILINSQKSIEEEGGSETEDEGADLPPTSATGPSQICSSFVLQLSPTQSTQGLDRPVDPDAVPPISCEEPRTAAAQPGNVPALPQFPGPVYESLPQESDSMGEKNSNIALHSTLPSAPQQTTSTVPLVASLAISSQLQQQQLSVSSVNPSQLSGSQQLCSFVNSFSFFLSLQGLPSTFSCHVMASYSPTRLSSLLPHTPLPALPPHHHGLRPILLHW